MSLFRFLLTFAFVVLLCVGTAQAGDGVNQAAAKAAMLKAYPGLFTISANTLTWNDGTTMIWDDGIQRSAAQLNETADIEDMFHYVYPTRAGPLTPAIDFDPGRVRYKPFFKKLYGASAQAVGQHIVGVRWLPKLGKGDIRVTKIFGIDRRLSIISDILDAMPAKISCFGNKPGGGFNWRLIASTNHLSMHSFGSAIDVNDGYSDNWHWHRNGASRLVHYRNRIPMALVALFEKEGFIWGGRWYHYDTMHFEYRPELLLYRP